ncbi:hypothetical protein, partial [Pseudomonas sp. MPR-AND1A]|uniref:hypothetical protein n=1 Tax=Pseudomonas sp. MPR-AND1A TaxID=2070600 RepID=UPI001C4952A8
LVEVSNKEATAKVRYHHFIIAEESVGARVWQNILNTISTTLDAKPPSATSSSEYLPTKDMNFSP